MYNSRIAAEVDEQQRALDYYRAELKQAQAVIIQLVEGRQGDTEYIHPYDLMAMVDKISIGTIWSLLNPKDALNTSYLEIAKIKYVQTTMMPRKRAEENVQAYDSLIFRLNAQKEKLGRSMLWYLWSKSGC